MGEGSKEQQNIEDIMLRMSDVPIGVLHLRYDKTLVMEYANDKFFEIAYYSRQEVLKQFKNNFESLIRKEDREKIRDKFERSILLGGTARVEYAIEYDNGTKWHMMYAKVLEDGAKPLLQCFVFDISDVKEQQVLSDIVVNNIFGGVVSIFYDGDGIFMQKIPERVYELSGYSKEEYEKLRLENPGSELILLKNYEQKLKDMLQNALLGDGRVLSEFKIRSKDGKDVWIELRGILAAKKEIGAVFQCVLTDITRQKANLDRMKKEKATLDIIVEISSDALFEYDIERDIMMSNRHESDANSGSIVMKNYASMVKTTDYVHPDDKEVVSKYLSDLQTGTEQFHFEFRRMYEGEYHWIEIEAKTIYDSEGKPVKVIGKSSDIDERKIKEEQLRIQSERDSLTKLYNHMTTIELIKDQLPSVNDVGYLLIMDIDDFKNINDSNGHLFGDAVLCTFADEIAGIFADGICGRIGGDEFIVFVQGISQEQLEVRVNKLQEKMGEVRIGKDLNETVSCSIGISVCDEKHKEYDDLFRWADSALYEKKSSGKSGFVYADYSMGEIPEISYLNTKTQDFLREESFIKNDEDMVLFAMEMLENVPDVKIGINMVIRRICNYFHIDDVMYIMKKGEKRYELAHHWQGANREDSGKSKVFNAPSEWTNVEKAFDKDGIVVYNEKSIAKNYDDIHGSVMLVKSSGKDIYKGIVAYIDRETDRDWHKEKSIINKLTSIIFNKLTGIEKMELEQQKREYQQNHDSITKLPHYYKFMQESLMFVEQYPERQYYLMYSDFSNFQHLNEVYGYETGDEVLYQYALTLQKKCRRGIGFSRMTSDHFVALLYEDNDSKLQKDMKRIAQKFCDTMNEKYTLSNLILSVGLCRWDRDKLSFSNAVDLANSARKYVKSFDQTDCIVYTDKIRSKTEVNLEIISRMANALEEGEFYAYLQPKVNLNTGKIAGAEALVRWIKPDGTMIYPDQFIPVFEKNGFVTKVDFNILEQVLHYLKDAMEKGEEIVPISVNFSRHHSEDTEFVERVVELLEKYDVPHKMLEAEVTESVYVNDVTNLNSNIQRLKDYGVTISIDDFGSGYSSLNVLAKVSADIIKLDRQFLDDCNEERGIEFIRHLVKLMKEMGYEVIAEGVETEEQIEILKAADCEMAQGYYYAKPMPIDKFREFLKEFNGRD